ncbi:MAG: hypothetical protein KAJ18_12150 [Candidatus Omnitrophica bacterium]|nr:hypothetical protein [Candidatus Omnitrophota bacterium]
MGKITLKTGQEKDTKTKIYDSKTDKKMMKNLAFLGAFKRFFSQVFGESKQMFRNNQARFSPANFSGLGSKTFKMNQRKERKKSHCRKVKRF